MVEKFGPLGLVTAGVFGLVAAWSGSSMAQAPAAPIGGAAKAKICQATGGPISAHVSPVWTIRVSSEGGACTHVRRWTGRSSNTAPFTVKVPPSRGQLTLTATNGLYYVTYTPTRGYQGPDSFTLVTPADNVVMGYTVEVVP